MRHPEIIHVDVKRPYLSKCLAGSWWIVGNLDKARIGGFAKPFP
jgi:hypothetical protein